MMRSGRSLVHTPFGRASQWVLLGSALPGGGIGPARSRRPLDAPSRAGRRAGLMGGFTMIVAAPAIDLAAVGDEQRHRRLP